MTDTDIRNCHGCKWLDEVKSQGRGNGYCCMVVRSKDYKPGMRIRYSNMERCGLYEKGDFATRYERSKSTQKHIKRR